MRWKVTEMRDGMWTTDICTKTKEKREQKSMFSWCRQMSYLQRLQWLDLAIKYMHLLCFLFCLACSVRIVSTKHHILWSQKTYKPSRHTNTHMAQAWSMFWRDICCRLFIFLAVLIATYEKQNCTHIHQCNIFLCLAFSFLCVVSLAVRSLLLSVGEKGKVTQ